VNELEALIILSSVPLLGSIKIRLLIHYYGSAVKALEASEDEVAELPGFGKKLVEGWRSRFDGEGWRRNLELAERHGAQIIPYTSPLFPKRLLEVADHPVVLYMRGEIRKEDQNGIAIVGTRQPSIYGLEMAEKIAHDLASMGFTIVSGLARGVDTAAHRGALKRGRTVAVIGSGLADIYPRENSQLADEVTHRGLLISEFPMSTPPDRQNFPQRNRIVSGMTLGTLLIEAPLKSGAMITMDRAFSQGRKLFALPGRADWEQFQGNHALIKNGQAYLVENAKDVVGHFENLNLFPEKKALPSAKPMLEKEEHDLLSMLPQGEVGIDQLQQMTKLTISKLGVLLMSLVLKKAVKEYPGKIYKKVF
jgi:DNA processing protein